MRIGIGGYYRYTSGMNLGEQDEHILDGFSAGLSLKFGKFQLNTFSEQLTGKLKNLPVFLWDLPDSLKGMPVAEPVTFVGDIG